MLLDTFHPSMDALAQIVSPASVVTGLVAVNLLAFAVFGIDKVKAATGGWRIGESTLLALALFGGTPGAYAGRSLFRHKMRKQPFSSRLHAIASLQVVGLGGCIGWALGG